MNNFPAITGLTLLPLIGGGLLLGLGADHKTLARRLALGVSALALALAVALAVNFNPSFGGLQFVQKASWVPGLGVDYFVGVDGLGLLMVLLTALVVPLALLASGRITERAPLYCALVLLLQAGLFGTFTAQNFFHWFLFWELSLVPAFFLIKLWGGPDRGPAATQFFVYTMVGSVAMLLSFLAIFLATGKFNFTDLAELSQNGQLDASLAAKLNWTSLSPAALKLVIFGGVFLGLAVKVPVMPFHTWLPTAYAEAPSPVTMLLTGLMSKMGVYGFLRILVPLFAAEMRAVITPLLWLAVITIVASAAAAFAQRDLKRMLAYSSINHLGYCLLGIFAAVKLTGADPKLAVEKAAVLDGVLLQMFNHGLTAATLFGFVGLLEQRSGGLRGLNDFGGVRKVAPVFAGLMGISVFASLGLPGLNGFIGEFLIFKGAFPLVTWATALAALGLLITAVFLLTLLQRVFQGPLNPKWSAFPDLTTAERWIVAPAVALMFLIGVYPQPVLHLLNATVLQFVTKLMS
jgi:NADH-quinone oxidoreductase subunit M